jgi:ribosomal protein S18 acetylase RimI-like enzyme
MLSMALQGHTVTLSWSQELESVDWHELEALYRAAPLGNKNAEELKIVFTNSRFRSFVREEGRLVAVGRALADGADCSYICDVAVLPSHQGRRLGKAVVQELVKLSHGHKKIILYSVPGKEGFYKKLGFLRMLTAMAIFRDPEAAIQRGHVSET